MMRRVGYHEEEHQYHGDPEEEAYDIALVKTMRCVAHGCNEDEVGRCGKREQRIIGNCHRFSNRVWDFGIEGDVFRKRGINHRVASFASHGGKCSQRDQDHRAHIHAVGGAMSQVAQKQRRERDRHDDDGGYVEIYYCVSRHGAPQVRLP